MEVQRSFNPPTQRIRWRTFFQFQFRSSEITSATWDLTVINATIMEISRQSFYEFFHNTPKIFAEFIIRIKSKPTMQFKNRWRPRFFSKNMFAQAQTKILQLVENGVFQRFKDNFVLNTLMVQLRFLWAALNSVFCEAFYLWPVSIDHVYVKYHYWHCQLCWIHSFVEFTQYHQLYKLLIPRKFTNIFHTILTSGIIRHIRN